MLLCPALVLVFWIYVTLDFIIPMVSCYNGTQCTAKRCLIKDSSIRFFHIGDWGGLDYPPYVTRAQQTVAAAMNRMDNKSQVSFVVSDGDNFYSSGVRRLHDIRFNKTFDDVYQFGKDEHLPWYIIAGNHDYYGNISVQMAYSRMNARWVYPDLFYVVKYHLSPSNTKVDIIMIDTVVLCGQTWHGGYDWRSDTTKLAYETPRGPKNKDEAERRWKWLQKRLAQSQADYLIVVGHYPVFSVGYHGDFICPGARMQRLLELYNVTAYLCGHDHTLQYLKSTSSTGWIVHHILSGAGSQLDKRTRSLRSHGYRVTSEFFFPTSADHHWPSTNNVGGFVYGELGRGTGSFSFYSGTGKLLYRVNLVSRRRSHVPNRTVGINYNHSRKEVTCRESKQRRRSLLYSAWFPSWFLFGDLSYALLPPSLRALLCT